VVRVLKHQFSVDSHRTKHVYAWARLVARHKSSKAHYGFPIPLLPCLRRPPASALPLLPTPSTSPRRARTTVESGKKPGSPLCSRSEFPSAPRLFISRSASNFPFSDSDLRSRSAFCMHACIRRSVLDYRA
jgi:hypothetical protein